MHVTKPTGLGGIQINQWADGIQAKRITPDDIPRGVSREQVQEELVRRWLLRKTAEAEVAAAESIAIPQSEWREWSSRYEARRAQR